MHVEFPKFTGVSSAVIIFMKPNPTICAQFPVYRATNELHWAKQTQTTTAAVASAILDFEGKTINIVIGRV